jgi:predicted amidohydrolase
MTLVVTLIQSTLHWENISANLEMFSKKIDAITETTDLIILPEMFSTGFSMSPETFAEDMNGSTVNWMREKAKQKNAVICGSFMCKDHGSFYNRLIWMRPDGTFSKYDKRHLFSIGLEHEHYTAGSEKLIELVKGWKVCPLVCYDLRFPVWSRRTVAADYDLLIYVANWPERRAFHWKTLLLARAIENQAFVIGLNRVGLDANDVSHSGDSVLIDPRGLVLSSLEANADGNETIVIEKTGLIEYRSQFPAINDADDFVISRSSLSY